MTKRKTPRVEADTAPPAQPTPISPTPGAGPEAHGTEAPPVAAQGPVSGESPPEQAPAANPPSFEEQAAKSIELIAAAVQQQGKVIAGLNEQIGRLNEAYMELARALPQGGGGDIVTGIMKFAESPMGQKIIGSFTGGGASSADPYQAMITEDVRRELSDMLRTVAKSRWQTALSLAKAAESGALEFRVKEQPTAQPGGTMQPPPPPEATKK